MRSFPVLPSASEPRAQSAFSLLLSPSNLSYAPRSSVSLHHRVSTGDRADRIAAVDHARWLRVALKEAEKCIPLPSAFCVGCVIVSPTTPPTLLATGYSRELPGNTHAEANAIGKLLLAQPDAAASLLRGAHLYTTLEPCSVRLSGNIPCTNRIIQAGIKKVYLGVEEPTDFVQCEGVRLLREAGIEIEVVQGFEEECLKAARRGH